MIVYNEINIYDCGNIQKFQINNIFEFIDIYRFTYCRYSIILSNETDKVLICFSDSKDKLITSCHNCNNY